MFYLDHLFFYRYFYFTDIKRGKVIKLGRAGIEKISDSQMRTYFNNKSIELIKSGGLTQIIGVFDSEFDEFIISYGATVLADKLPQHYLYKDSLGLDFPFTFIAAAAINPAASGGAHPPGFGTHGDPAYGGGPVDQPAPGNTNRYS